MSQNIANTGLPTPTAIQDWTIVPDEDIQLASDDNKETADAKYAKRQCQKQSETLVETMPRSVPVENRLRASAPVGDRPGVNVPVPAESGGPRAGRGFKGEGEG
ncbi:hypothetical protein EDC04DRAFT_2598479 [Pisolithus marmoratus]|nr:hypothetical protein EDC04DRAFT_2598479 [Pisolithus marmoratus]